MTMDAYSAVESAIYSAVRAVNAETVPGYPPGIFTGPISAPITVYEVEVRGEVAIQGQERRVAVTVRLDHFAGTRGEMSTIAGNARAALVGMRLKCAQDSTGKTPGGLFRRSQVYTGIYDTIEQTFYEGERVR